VVEDKERLSKNREITGEKGMYLHLDLISFPPVDVC